MIRFGCGVGVMVADDVAGAGVLMAMSVPHTCGGVMELLHQSHYGK